MTRVEIGARPLSAPGRARVVPGSCHLSRRHLARIHAGQRIVLSRLARVASIFQGFQTYRTKGVGPGFTSIGTTTPNKSWQPWQGARQQCADLHECLPPEGSQTWHNPGTPLARDAIAPDRKPGSTMETKTLRSEASASSNHRHSCGGFGVLRSREPLVAADEAQPSGVLDGFQVPSASKRVDGAQRDPEPSSGLTGADTRSRGARRRYVRTPLLSSSRLAPPPTQSRLYGPLGSSRTAVSEDLRDLRPGHACSSRAHPRFADEIAHCVSEGSHELEARSSFLRITRTRPDLALDCLGDDLWDARCRVGLRVHASEATSPRHSRRRTRCCTVQHATIFACQAHPSGWSRWEPKESS